MSASKEGSEGTQGAVANGQEDLSATVECDEEYKDSGESWAIIGPKEPVKEKASDLESFWEEGNGDTVSGSHVEISETWNRLGSNLGKVFLRWAFDTNCDVNDTRRSLDNSICQLVQKKEQLDFMRQSQALKQGADDLALQASLVVAARDLDVGIEALKSADRALGRVPVFFKH